MTWDEWIELKNKILEIAEKQKKQLMVYQDEINFSICDGTILEVEINGDAWVFCNGNTCAVRVKIANGKTSQQLLKIVEDFI